MSLDILSSDYQSSYLLDSEDYLDIHNIHVEDLPLDIREDVSAIGWDTAMGKGSTLAMPNAVVPEPVVPDAVVPEPAVPALPHRQNNAPESYVVKPQPGYIQGIIRGHQAYLITNLRNSTSSSLYQPQMTWTIGRNRDAALPLHDRMLSRRHSVLMYVKSEGFYLVDLNSTNGSYVNGKRVENRIQLQDGDFIRVGHTEFFFFLSTGYRKIESIHPQVLNRLLNPEEKGNDHIDYAEIWEEISFNLNR